MPTETAAIGRNPSSMFVAFIAALVVLAAATWASAQDQNRTGAMPKVREFRIERAMPKEAVACIECHKKTSPGIFSDWAASRHASANITCLDCHLADPNDPDVSKIHFKQYERSDYSEYGTSAYRVPVAAIVSPKDCSRCHPDEVKQYSVSKHANTVEIMWKLDPWLNKGMNSDLERRTGCYHCHGTVVELDEEGRLTPETWPNVGVGRVNPDGSLGSCTSCHTRHLFSVAEARKPGSCGQCHLGPDHPQKEIYQESKHGYITEAQGDGFNWTAAPGTWTAGVDYRAPSCAACHMSGAAGMPTSHDVTRRLAWESQAPLTVRPSEFKPFPARTSHEQEREDMKRVCLQCHGNVWVDDHFTKVDEVMVAYNEIYYKPAKARLDELYEKGLLDDSKFFDEHLEVQFYELWHHEGRRARMGTQMMAPDYTWWHGFYECKLRYNAFMEEAEHLVETGKHAWKAEDFPAATGDTTRPPVIFGKE